MGINRFEAKKKEVIGVLDENPELSSSQLALETQLSFDELQEVYLQIKGKIPSIGGRTFGIQNFFRQVLEADVLSDRKRLEKFKNEEFVFPDRLELHLGKTCQCACRFCWRWSDGQWKEGALGLYDRKHGNPSLREEDIMNLLQEFKKYGGKQLFLSGGLEFFTNDLAEYVIESAAKLGLIIRAYTNGVSDCFDTAGFEDMILNKAEYIRFSFHAIKPDTYSELQMPHRDKKEAEEEFMKVKERIKKLVERRKQLKESSKIAKISIAFLVTGYNYRELKEAIHVWKGIGVDSFDIRVDMREKEIWFTKNQEKELEEIMEEIRVQREEGRYDPMEVTGKRHETRNKIKLPEKCFIPFKKPTVDPWGVVYTCCYGAHPSLQHHKYELGNLHKETLFEILERLHNDRIIPLPHCAQCPDWELSYNQAIEKVLRDWQDGFPPENLPFCS